jgi:hypothetical protein
LRRPGLLKNRPLKWIKQDEITSLKWQIQVEEVARTAQSLAPLQPGFGLTENTSLDRQTRSKVTHARTQSELPANIKLSAQNFVGFIKKSIQFKEDSPLFEKDSQSSEPEDSGVNPTPPVESAASLRSKQESIESRLGARPSSVKKSTKGGPKKSPLLEERFVLDLAKLHHPFTGPVPPPDDNPKTVPKKTEGLLDWPPVPAPFESRTEQKMINRDSKPIDTSKNQPLPPLISGSSNKKEPANKLKDQPGFPHVDPKIEYVLNPERAPKRAPLALKLEADDRLQKPSTKVLKNLLTDFPPTNRHSADAIEASKRFVTTRELLDMNADLFDRTHQHSWQKIDCPDLSHPFELFNVANKKSLTLADSKAAHFDVIRKVEFVEEPGMGLMALTFSEDATIRTWKVLLQSSEMAVLDSPQKAVSTILVPHHSRYHPGLAEEDKLTKELLPPIWTYQTSKRQIGRATSFLNMDGQKGIFPRLKRGAIVRAHFGSIFSSCVSRPGDRPVRIFSGDRLGSVNCFSLESGLLKPVRTFRTGSEPVWDIDLLDHDLLVTSSPNKVKVYRVSKASDRREELLFENKTGLFGKLKTLDDRTIIVNTYDAATLANEFIGFDVPTQSESFRIASSQQFCNAMAVIPNMGILLSANEDKTVSIYDTREHCQTNHFNAHSDSVTSISVCPDKNVFVTGGADSSVRLWDLRSLRIHNEIHAHRRKFDDSIFDVKFDPAGRIIGSGGAEGTLKIFQF